MSRLYRARERIARQVDPPADRRGPGHHMHSERNTTRENASFGIDQEWHE
jgi:hypothetical protein